MKKIKQKKKKKKKKVEIFCIYMLKILLKFVYKLINFLGNLVAACFFNIKI